MRFCQLLELRGKIQSIEVEELFEADSPNVEIITLSDGGVLVLSAMQIIDLRGMIFSLFEGVTEKDVYHKYVLS